MPVKMLLVRVDLAERFLEEAKAHLGKGDPVRARSCIKSQRSA